MSWLYSPLLLAGGEPPVTGTLAKTLADVTVTSVGTVAVAGTLAKTLAGVSTVSGGFVGTAEGADPAPIPSIGLVLFDVPTRTATLVKTLAGIGLNAVGLVIEPGNMVDAPAPLPSLGLVLYYDAARTGTVNVTLEAVALDSDANTIGGEPAPNDLWEQPEPGAVSFDWIADVTWWSYVSQTDEVGGLVGGVDRVLEALTFAAAGTVESAGVLVPALEDLTLDAFGSEGVNGDLAKTLADVTVLGAGDVSSNTVATMFTTLADVTIASAGNVHVAGILITPALGSLGVIATGTVSGGNFIGTLTRTLAPVTLSSSGFGPIDGVALIPLEDISHAFTGSVLSGFVASLNAFLEDVTMTAEGTSITIELGVRRRYTTRGRESTRVVKTDVRAAEVELEGETVE